MGQRVSGGLQVNWGCERWEGRLPRLMTNRNVMLVLEGRTGFEERVELNVTRAKPAHWLLQIFLCVCLFVCVGGLVMRGHSQDGDWDQGWHDS